ncbi:hypothetical protein L218DRAFT_860023 [Marasmius fiardii PR-910]|nr:hypothetical protein L218DRAFT_860023 [Marasmius fiardii PR-910]
MLQPFLGGVGLALPVYTLMFLNGNVLGISGFAHRAVRGNLEATIAVIGLLVGGGVSGMLDGVQPQLCVGLPLVLLSGLMVGAGSKAANGCTSGHMISGISKLSKRSFVATSIFFVVGAPVARLLHSLTLTPVPPSQNQPPSLLLDTDAKMLLVSQVPPLLLAVLLWYFAILPRNVGQSLASQFSRLLLFLSTSIEFALALRLSGMVDCEKVLRFLLLPNHPAFDPSLIFLALGALPLSLCLHQFYLNRGKSAACGNSGPPGVVDARLICGAVLFGGGWGICGICPGPAIVNLGRALVTGAEVSGILTWLFGFVLGGVAVSYT